MLDSSAVVRPGMFDTNRELRSGVSIFWPDTIHPEMSAMSFDRSSPASISSRAGDWMFEIDGTHRHRVIPGRKNLEAGVIGVAAIYSSPLMRRAFGDSLSGKEEAPAGAGADVLLLGLGSSGGGGGSVSSQPARRR